MTIIEIDQLINISRGIFDFPGASVISLRQRSIHILFSVCENTKSS